MLIFLLNFFDILDGNFIELILEYLDAGGCE
jgi:hypothetical protein